MADPIPTTSQIYKDNAGENATVKYQPGQFGVFGLHPLMTPKYAQGKPRDAEFRDTLARMFISLPTSGNVAKLKQNYLDSLPGDARIKSLAQVLLNSNTGFIDFFLTQCQEQFQEKVQIDETLADNYVAFYFGQHAPIFSYSGMLLNSQQDDQTTGFALAYQNLFRGTALARTGTLLRLRYDNKIIGGTIESYTTVQNAENELAVPFTFTLRVKEYVLQLTGRYDKLSVADFVQLSTITTQQALTDVGQVQDARLRTTVVTTPSPAQTSVAGNAEQTTVVDKTQPATAQLQSQISLTTQPPSATSNIRGDVITPEPLPLALAGSEG